MAIKFSELKTKIKGRLRAVDWKKYVTQWNNLRFKKWISFAVVFTFSFGLFLFLTFPYEIFKETISNNIKRASGIDVNIGTMGMSLPVGIKLLDVKVSKPGVAQILKFEQVRVNISMLQFMMGNLGLSFKIQKSSGITKKELGQIHLGVKLGILLLIFSKTPPLPSVNLYADNFAIDDVTNLAFGILGNSRGISPMFQPVLEAVKFTGMMTGNMNIVMSGAKAANASGIVNLELKKASLEAGAALSRQEFSKMLIKAEVKDGKIMFDKNSGINSRDLSLSIIGGRIVLKEPLMMSDLDVKVDLKMSGDIEPLGSMAVRAAGLMYTEGQPTTITISGPFVRPAFN